MGKPNENKFSDGAEREMTPTVTLTISKVIAIGVIIIAADKNIEPAADIPANTRVSAETKVPIGIAA